MEMSFFILYNDQRTYNSLTNYHTPTCFDTILSSSGRLQSTLPSYTNMSNAIFMFVPYINEIKTLY